MEADRMYKLTKIFLLLISLLAAMRSDCQQPGGAKVKGPKLWLQTDNTYKWINKIGTSTVTTNDTAKKPFHTNFHPAKYFNGSGSYFFPDLIPTTIVGIYYPDVAHSKARNEDTFYTVKFNSNKICTLTDTIIYCSSYPSVPYHPNYKISNDSDAYQLMKTTPCYTGVKVSYNENAFGNDRETGLDMRFNGYCPEIIVYEDRLSDTEIWKIQTYMAIKYGVTLNHSYLGTDGNILWDKNVNKRFYHRVCAIGKDTSENLYQYKSSTTYEEVNSAFSNSSNNERYSNTDSTSLQRSLTISFDDQKMQRLSNNSFLFWGDDADPISSFESSAKFPGLEITKRRWCVFNVKKIPSLTRVEMSGALARNLTLPNYINIFIKLSTPLRSENLFQLTPNKDGIYSLDNVIWNSVDSFTFSRAPTLRFMSIVCKDNLMDEAPPLTPSYKKGEGYFTSTTSRESDWKHLCLFTRKRVAYELFSSSDGRSQVLEFYCTGGIESSFTLTDNRTHKNIAISVERNEATSTYTVKNIPNGTLNCTLIGTDDVNQKIKMIIATTH